MPLSLTVPQTLSNATRLFIKQKRWSEDDESIRYEVSLRMANNGTVADGIVSLLAGEIRGPNNGGTATVIARNTPPAGSPLQELLRYNASLTVNTTQYAAALAAVHGNAAAFEQFLLTAGYLHSSLAGT